MKIQKIYIVSWNGVKSSGGVERVTQDMYLSWKKQYDVEIIDFERIKKRLIFRLLLGRHYVLDAILVSVYINQEIKKYKRDDVKIVVQGFNAPLVKADIMGAHGTMRGYKVALEGAKAKWHLNQKFEQISAKKAKKVIAVGNKVKEELNQLYGIDKRKIIVVENCVDTDSFYPIQKPNVDSITRILFAGRLEYGKGLNTLIKLAEHIENLENIKLIIATNAKTNIECFANLKNTEIKVGLIKEEMNKFYNSGDVMFFPSLYEGFGLVTIEALSAGIPVLGNQTGVLDDLYNKGQKGIGIISDNMEKNVALALEIARNYNSYEAKERLHQDMVERYSLNIYKEKLEKLWD